MNEDLFLVNTFVEGLEAWFSAKAAELDFPWFLAHADDGVIWGRWDDGDLTLSGKAFPELEVKLRIETLQQARLFGPAGELFLWRSQGGFSVRRITADIDCPDEMCLPLESRILWGEGVKTNLGFTLMREGSQGLLHAVPLPNAIGKRAALKVRQYISYDADDQAFITHSRLVDLVVSKEG